MIALGSLPYQSQHPSGVRSICAQNSSSVFWARSGSTAIFSEVAANRWSLAICSRSERSPGGSVLNRLISAPLFCFQEEQYLKLLFTNGRAFPRLAPVRVNCANSCSDD